MNSQRFSPRNVNVFLIFVSQQVSLVHMNKQTAVEIHLYFYFLLCLLKTNWRCSGRRFPYPSVSEIMGLSSQTKFSEEQIKVWFSAQRLKHGVSWTPEEVGAL